MPDYPVVVEPPSAYDLYCNRSEMTKLVGADCWAIVYENTDGTLVAPMNTYRLWEAEQDNNPIAMRQTQEYQDQTSFLCNVTEESLFHPVLSGGAKSVCVYMFGSDGWRVTFAVDPEDGSDVFTIHEAMH